MAAPSSSSQQSSQNDIEENDTNVQSRNESFVGVDADDLSPSLQVPFPYHRQDEGAGCYATLKVDLATTEDYVFDGIYDDSARFQIELHSIGDSRVSYKGMDGEGYSFCCALLDAPFAKCDWFQDPIHSRQTLKIVQCDLTNEELVEGTLLKGAIRKPLHRVLGGAWTATVKKSKITKNDLVRPI